ncbi:unnamed protein product [Sphacelaria rigidula]
MSATCGAPGCSEPANQRCSRCKSVHYCTRECQRAAWIDHKDMCAYLASRRGSMDEGDLMEQTCVILRSQSRVVLASCISSLPGVCVICCAAVLYCTVLLYNIVPGVKRICQCT